MSAREEVLADLIAPHDAYRVNDDGWTVCICGHVAEGDDDDGSHARHVAAALVAALAAQEGEPRWHFEPAFERNENSAHAERRLA